MNNNKNNFSYHKNLVKKINFLNTKSRRVISGHMQMDYDVLEKANTVMEHWYNMEDKTGINKRLNNEAITCRTPALL